MGEIFREMLAEAEARRNDMTTEKQTPEALAAECKRLAEEAVTAHRRDGMLRQTKLGPVAVSALHAAIDRLAAIASAQAQQEPPVAHGVFVGTRLVKLEESAQLAGEWAQREIVRGSPLTYHIRPLYTSAPPVQQAELKESAQYNYNGRPLASAQAQEQYRQRRDYETRIERRVSLLNAAAPERAGVVPDALKHAPDDPKFSDEQNACHEGFVNGWNACRQAVLTAAPPAPAAAEREPLTDRQIIAAIEAHGLNLAWRCYEHDIDCARAIERAHGIGISPADAKENGNG